MLTHFRSFWSFWRWNFPWLLHKGDTGQNTNCSKNVAHWGQCCTLGGCTLGATGVYYMIEFYYVMLISYFSPEAIKEILGHCHLLHMLCYFYKVYILILILAMDSTRGPKYWSTLLVAKNNWNRTESTFEISWYWTAISFILSAWITQGKSSIIDDQYYAYRLMNFIQYWTQVHGLWENYDEQLTVDDEDFPVPILDKSIRIGRRVTYFTKIIMAFSEKFWESNWVGKSWKSEKSISTCQRQCFEGKNLKLSNLSNIIFSNFWVCYDRQVDFTLDWLSRKRIEKIPQLMYIFGCLGLISFVLSLSCSVIGHLGNTARITLEI